MIIYLAVPYSHPDPAVRQRRFEAANRAAGAMMRDGLHVFSPISHTHPIAMAGGLPLDWDYWEGYDRAMLGACSELVVLTLDGWQESVGVRNEMAIAAELGLPVRFMEPCPPHHWMISYTETGNSGACLKCGADMPPEKGSNIDRREAASRKSQGQGRDWRGKAMTVVGDKPCYPQHARAGRPSWWGGRAATATFWGNMTLSRSTRPVPAEFAKTRR